MINHYFYEVQTTPPANLKIVIRLPYSFYLSAVVIKLLITMLTSSLFLSGCSTYGAINNSKNQTNRRYLAIQFNPSSVANLRAMLAYYCLFLAEDLVPPPWLMAY
jgi:hypothetical protein